MPANLSFESPVAARTRLARTILETPDLLQKYLEDGGLKDELVEIADRGREAEVLNQAQGSANTDGKAATLDVLVAFAKLGESSGGVMAAVTAVRGELVREGANPAVIGRVDDILANEAEVGYGERVDAEGKKVRTARKSESQEAVRAEIERDASSLLAFPVVLDRLEKRRITRAKIEKLRDDAALLSGKLGVRAAKKGDAKTATESEHKAVAAQRAAWGAAYRLIARLGRKDNRVGMLLADCSRARKSK